jgi:putative aminopeptidase FrvX
MNILDEELYQAGMKVAACPTAACHEDHVRDLLLKELRDLPHLTTRLDEFGNLHASYEYKAAGREAFRLVAHMDHPAFVVYQRGGQVFRGQIDRLS